MIDRLPKRRWQDMKTTDFQGAAVVDWIAVLPVAAIEQHGPHLPVGTDTIIGEGMIDAALSVMPDALPVSVLPIQQIGKSNEHISSPGTLTHDWQTVIQAWIEIGESVNRAGLKKMIIINSHGGNVSLIDIVARELRVRHEMLVVATSWARFGVPDALVDQTEQTYGIHGGDDETSMMLHLRPDLVDMSNAKDFRSTQLDFLGEFKQLRAHGPVPFGWKAQDLNVEGTVGNAAEATAEKGELRIQHQAAAFVDLCHDVHAFDLDRLWKPA
ncbi:MAG: creatininase family protein [Pseudomonadota bacterium]